MKLDTRYQPIRVLHHSQDMDVIIVQHTEIGDTRVLKKIRKHQSTSNADAAFQLRRETTVLKGLRHPGIPVLYDFWEDEQEICLIEEYVRGLSLQEYLLRYQKVDLKFISEVLSQLLEVLEFLHEIPIHHQDLKSEHVILRDNRVVLIDYGIAEFTGCRESSDAADDIYAAGLIAKELTDHCAGFVPHEFRRMIRKALSRDKSAGYVSVAGWREDLSEWQGKSRNDKKGLLISNITVVGNGRGIGTTHIAVSITSYLCHSGYKAYYRNMSGRPGFLALEENLNTDFKEKDGIIYHQWFTGIVDYGPTVEPQQTPAGICVTDAGTDFSNASGADVIVYVVGSRPWQSRQLMKEYISKDSCILMITPENPGMAVALAKAAGVRVISMPYDENPMHPDGKVIRLYEQIFKAYKG